MTIPDFIKDSPGLNLTLGGFPSAIAIVALNLHLEMILKGLNENLAKPPPPAEGVQVLFGWLCGNFQARGENSLISQAEKERFQAAFEQGFEYGVKATDKLVSLLK